MKTSYIRHIFQLFLLIAPLVYCSCGSNTDKPSPDDETAVSEFSDYYSVPKINPLFSTQVKDSFRIYNSLPKGYDEKKKYPLIIVLDANTLFEPLREELKFNTFLGYVPRSVLIGVGYKNFRSMDSLRSRDYTFPAASEEYDMPLSGGADKFKQFLDQELIPQLLKQYPNIDMERSVLCGHSLGAYFSLYYLLKSTTDKSGPIRNFVSASPELFYQNRYLFTLEKNTVAENISSPTSLYISMGSEDMEEEQSKDILKDFSRQITDKHYPGLRFRSDEYSNFGHYDAAIPGLIKGLSFILKK